MMVDFYSGGNAQVGLSTKHLAHSNLEKREHRRDCTPSPGFAGSPQSEAKEEGNIAPKPERERVTGLYCKEIWPSHRAHSQIKVALTRKELEEETPDFAPPAL